MSDEPRLVQSNPEGHPCLMEAVDPTKRLFARLSILPSPIERDRTNRGNTSFPIWREARTRISTFTPSPRGLQGHREAGFPPAWPFEAARRLPELSLPGLLPSPDD